jgi:hypothetical protein
MTTRPPPWIPEAGPSDRSVDALDATNSKSGAPADDTASPPEVPGVLVSYQQFMERRALRRRMIALAGLDQKRTLNGEVLGSVDVDNGKPRDEI